MTAEFVLLLTVYATLVMGIFVHPDRGLVNTFHSALPALSARIEKHVACGEGFWEDAGVRWQRPTNPPRYQNNLWGL